MDMPIGRRTEASMELRVNARCTSERAGERGQSLFEFALVLPLLLLLLLGMVVFGVALNNYLELTNGTTAGAQAVAISRGQTTDPCATAATPFSGAAASLTAANVSFTITTSTGPGGSGTSNTLWPSGANPTCPAGSTTSPPASYLVQGGTITVKATYPCNLKIFGINFAPGTCTLTAQTAESVQ